MIVSPVQEMGLMPSKVFRLSDTSSIHVQEELWSIVVVFDVTLNPNLKWPLIDPYLVRAGINVTIIPRGSSPSTCELIEDYPERHMHSHQGNSTVEFVPQQFICRHPPYPPPSPSPRAPHIINAFTKNYLGSSVPDTTGAPPSVFVAVNFTTLGLLDHGRTPLSILMGLTADIDDVLANTVPTLLLPGSHLYAGFSREYRQKFVKPSAASFGIFSTLRTFPVANVVSLATDASRPQLEDTATLQLYDMVDPSDWRVVQDYREKTVLGGFATTGGLWTFVNGFFTIFFGSGILLVIFGIKPISFLGIVDNIYNDRVRDEWSKVYPRLMEEMNLPREQRGHMALIRDHLLDLQLFEEGKGPNGAPDTESVPELPGIEK